MSTVILLNEVRASRLQKALAACSRTGEAVIIGTIAGPVAAERIICRSNYAEILDSFGNYSAIRYADIRSLDPAPVPQTSIVNARGDFGALQDAVKLRRPTTILPFAPRPRRR